MQGTVSSTEVQGCIFDPLRETRTFAVRHNDIIPQMRELSGSVGDRSVCRLRSDEVARCRVNENPKRDQMTHHLRHSAARSKGEVEELKPNVLLIVIRYTKREQTGIYRLWIGRVWYWTRCFNRRVKLSVTKGSVSLIIRHAGTVSQQILGRMKSSYCCPCIISHQPPVSREALHSTPSRSFQCMLILDMLGPCLHSSLIEY